MLYQGHRFLGGINHFWMAVSVWKTNRFVEDLAREKRTTVCPKEGISSGLVDVWQSEWAVVLNLNRHTVHEILKFELGMQKICAKLVPKILTNEQKENQSNVCLDYLEHIENDKFFQTCHNRWWIVDFQIRSWHQMTKFEVAHEQLRAPTVGKNEQIKNQKHANLFFRQSRRYS
jgi:hypothetical protein